jgi:ribosomal protein L37AE/L43A
MADSQPPTPEDQDEITTFITEGMHRLATISTNDYGFLLSARMAQTYLQRAVQLLDTKPSLNRAMRNEIAALKTIAGAMTHEYVQFETFCSDCERFKHRETKDLIEWCSKCAVRAISSGYLGTVSHHLAHKIRTFHARVCSVLTEA